MDKSPVPASHAIANMVLFNVGIVLSILALHEIGHVLLGVYVGCEAGRAIIFDTLQEGPYAELVCSNSTDYTIAYTGSLLLTTIFAVIFLFLRDSPYRNFFLVVIGFNILFASLDLVALFGMETIQYVSIGLGMVLVIIGEFLTGWAFSET